MNEYKGGCACGSVRYQSGADPSFSYLCQCRQCQKASGAGHAALFMVDEESLSLTGELRFFDQVGDSGNAIGRGFCPKCGSPVMATLSAYPDARFIHAATLDDPSIFQPRQVLWRSSAQPWDYVDQKLTARVKGSTSHRIGSHERV